MALVVLTPTDTEFFETLTQSFQQSVGHSLVPEGEGPVWLYRSAPFSVVAHNADPDPTFVYANITAQDCFGYEWGEFTKLKSKLSAGPTEREERQALLDAVHEKGFVSGYRGLRVRKTGAHFWMEDGLIWNLRGRLGEVVGQAAMFAKWSPAP